MNNSPTTSPDVNPPKVEIVIDSGLKTISTVSSFIEPSAQVIYLSKQFSAFLANAGSSLKKAPEELFASYNENAHIFLEAEALHGSYMDMTRVIFAAEGQEVNHAYGVALEKMSQTINLALEAGDVFNGLKSLIGAPQRIISAIKDITGAIKGDPIKLKSATAAIADILNNADKLSDIDTVIDLALRNLDGDIVKAFEGVRTLAKEIKKDEKNITLQREYFQKSLAILGLGTSTNSMADIMKNDTDRQMFFQDMLIEELHGNIQPSNWQAYGKMPVYQKVSVFNDGILWDSYTCKLVETTAKEAYPQLFK